MSTTGAGTVTLSSTGGNLAVNDGVSAGTGKVTLQSTDESVTFGANGDVTTTSGEIEVQAVTAAKTITMVDGTVLDAGDDIIDLDAGGNVVLGQLTTTSAATAAGMEAVNINAGGAVSEVTTAATVITAAGRLVVDAVNGVGDGDAIETSVESLDIDNTTMGSIDIDNNFTTGAVTAVNLNVAAGSGTISFDNTGNQSLAVTSATTNDGTITITNTGDLAADLLTATTVTAGGSGNIQLTTNTRGDVVIDGNLTATTSTITIDSSDDITLGNAITVSTGAGGQINLNVDTNNDVAAILELGTGSTVTSADINFSGSATNLNDTIAAQDLANTWIITGSGTLDNANLSTTADWTDFQNIEGGTGVDTIDQSGGTAPDNPIAVVITDHGTADGMAGNVSGTGITTANFDNIDEIFTDETGSTITGAAAAQIATPTWTLNGGNENYADTGGTGQDLDFSGSGIFTTLTGGSGADKFDIDASYTGSLVGGAGADEFEFSDGVTLTGTVDGGADSDTLDLALVADITGVNITGTGSTDGSRGTVAATTDDPISSGGDDFDNIDSLVGATVAPDFTGPPADTVWRITGASSGTYGNDGNETAFTNFNISGNTFSDTFLFDGGTIGSIAGGGSGSGTFNSDTIIADNAGRMINITGDVAGQASGTIVGLFTVTGFTGIDNVFGGTGSDTFTVSDGVTVNGVLAGNLGNDVITFNNTSTVTWTIDGLGTRTEVYDSNDTAPNSTVIVGDIDAADAAVDGNSGTATGTGFNFIEMETVNGTGVADIFNIKDVDNALTINAGAGDDTFNVSSNAPTNTGTVDDITALLTLRGDADSGAGDTLNISDSANGSAKTGAITATAVTGIFGAGGSISYSDGGGNATENISISLSNTGGDTFTFTGLDAGSTVSVAGNGGNDIFNLNTDIGVGSMVMGGDNNDTFNINVSQTATADFMGEGGDDTFDLANNVTLASDMAGGTGDDTVDWADDTSVTVTLSSTGANGFNGSDNLANMFTDINNVTGNNTDATLEGINANADWNLAATANDGTYDSTNMLDWVDFNNLTGGTMDDSFNFMTGSSMTGTIDGGVTGTNDVLDWSAFNADVSITLAAPGTDNGFQGTTATGIGTGYDNINAIVGDAGQSNTLIGDNVASSFNISGADIGTYTGGNTLGWTGFGNLTGGSMDDDFDFTGGSVSGNIAGGGGTNDRLDYSGVGGPITVNLATDTATSITGNFSAITAVIGSGNAADELIGENNMNTWTVDMPDSGDVDGFDFDAIANLTGGTAVDIFNFTGTGNISGTAAGDDGNDDFTLGTDVSGTLEGEVGDDEFFVNVDQTGGNALLGGANNDLFDLADTVDVAAGVDGEAGTDTIDWADFAADVSITLTSVGGTDGFNGSGGTAGNVTGFSNIDEVVGPAAQTNTITGLDAISTWAMGGGNDGTYTSGNALTLTNMNNLTGGSAVDTFNITGAHTGNLRGEGDDDILNINAVLTGNIFGNTGDDTFDFTGGSTTGLVSGGIGDDSITGASGFMVNGGNSGTATEIPTGWSTIENISGTGNFVFNAGGSIDGLATGAGGTITFANHTATLDGTGPNAFTGFGTIDMSNMGQLLGDPAGSVWALTSAAGGTVDGITMNNVISIGTTGTNTFTANGMFNGGIDLAGNNTWNFTAGDILTNGAVIGDGALLIPGGGADVTVGPAGLNLPNLVGFGGDTFIGANVAPATLPLNGGSIISSMADTLTVTVDIDVGGGLAFFGSDIIFDTSAITTDGPLAVVAVGPAGGLGGTGTGLIDIQSPVDFDANSGVFIAEDQITNPQDITLLFGGGDVEFLVTNNGDSLNQVQDGGANSVDATPESEAFVALLGLSVNAVVVSFFNPASALIGLVEVAFIDVGLFEEELTLFGTIGNGIALALAQCEEIEGCAPNVTEEELEALIADLEASINDIENRLPEEPDPATRAKLEELLAGFQEELENFRSYQQQLIEFFAADEEEFEDDFGEEGFDEEFDEEAPLVAPDVNVVDRLADVLKAVNARIEWLESLKTDPEERARLSAITGIELTQEALDEIIEATKREAGFIENMIKSMLEGKEVRLQPEEDVEGYSFEQPEMDNLRVAHGPSLLDLDAPATTLN
ncbi:MAG: ABC transporter C-terminal domain-containing protein [Thiotrichales bacterium]|nr:ABC transporter C-terminal domain-containing protein [Thiotrichales bacterium]